jgi:hypothetical protein
MIVEVGAKFSDAFARAVASADDLADDLAAGLVALSALRPDVQWLDRNLPGCDATLSVQERLGRLDD